MRDESRAREFPAEGEKSQKADCAKNAAIPAGEGTKKEAAEQTRGFVKYLPKSAF